MDSLNVSQATLVASAMMANIGLIFGAYVSIRVSVAKLEVKVDGLVKDVDSLWSKLRETKGE